MEQIDQDNLDTAIALGEAVCTELEICCEKRGQVIFQLYRKLEDLKTGDAAAEKPEADETQAEQSANGVSESSVQLGDLLETDES